VIESQQDSTHLQNCLDSLKEWADAWQLTISIKKCQTIHIGSKVQLRHLTPSEGQFHIGQEFIPNVESVTDLGVTIDSSIKFSQHIGKIVRKAASRCYLIRKCFVSKDTATLVSAFKTYVRPLLEYNSPVWSPHLLKDINLIEKVQRRFTKYLKGLYNVSYDERLLAVNLERLEARRIRCDVITAYKIIFGLTVINCSDFFTFSNTAFSTRGHHYKLLPPSCNCDTRRHCFTSRVAYIWNNLPAGTTDFSSLIKFKNSLNCAFFNRFCIGEH
jgi:hypothetical protein